MTSLFFGMNTGLVHEHHQCSAFHCDRMTHSDIFSHQNVLITMCMTYMYLININQILFEEPHTYLQHPIYSLALHAVILGVVPELMIPAVHSLADGLGSHVVTTLWDQLFRQTLVQGRKFSYGADKEKVSNSWHRGFHSSNQIITTLVKEAEGLKPPILKPTIGRCPLSFQPSSCPYILFS